MTRFPVLMRTGEREHIAKGDYKVTAREVAERSIVASDSIAFVLGGEAGLAFISLVLEG
jgi:hypothetical protein